MIIKSKSHLKRIERAKRKSREEKWNRTSFTAIDFLENQGKLPKDHRIGNVPPPDNSDDGNNRGLGEFI